MDGMVFRGRIRNLLLEPEIVGSMTLLLGRTGKQIENEITSEGWVHVGKQNLADGDWTGKLSEEVLIEFGTVILYKHDEKRGYRGILLFNNSVLLLNKDLSLVNISVAVHDKVSKFFDEGDSLVN